MSHAAYSAARSGEVLVPLPEGKMPTPGYLRSMMEKGAREAGKEFYDPIVEIVKLGLTSDDERIRFACHSHVSDKLYPKAKELEPERDAADSERASKRAALIDKVLAAFEAKRVAKLGRD